MHAWSCLAIVVLGAVIGSLIVTDGVATAALANGELETAADWRGSRSDVLSARAEQQLARGNNLQALALAREALHRAPLDVRALRVMGLIAWRGRDQRRALDLIGFAGTRSWRDDDVQLWLFTQAALTGDAAAFAQRGDALLRRERQMPLVLAAFAGAVADPRARHAVAERLASGPAWRQAFFDALAHQPAGTLDALPKLIADLTAAGTRPTGKELAGPLDTLIADGRAAEARAIWSRLPGAGDRAGPVADGSFARAAGAGGATSFDWRLADDGGAQIGQPPLPDRGRALLIAANGAAEYPAAQQTVVLARGRRTLDLRMLPEQSAGAARFRVDVVCLPSRTSLTRQKPSAPKIGVWNALVLRFDVPVDGCSAQRLLLMMSADEAASDASVWIDDVVAR
jgi:hypothetical protein